MTIRWDVERALMWSNLRPLARFVVLALATKANSETGIIPDEFAPSLATLAAMTGLSKSQVAKELAYLDGLAWVKRSKPARQSRYDRTSYAIAVGANDPDRASGPQRGQLNPIVHDSDSYPDAESDPVVRSTDSSGEGSGPQRGRPVVRDTDSSTETADKAAGNQQSATRTSPQHGHATTTTHQKTTTKRTSRPKVRDIPRPDVDQLCQHLADWIVKNGCKPPTISDEWRDEARRMLDLDKRDFAKSMNLIDWCQKSKFWRPNIQSMPTFREKYDQLRLQALAEYESGKNGTGRYAGPYTDDAPERDYKNGSL